MQPIDEVNLYAEKILKGDIDACKYVRLACRRHINDLERPELFLDNQVIGRVFNFFRMLKHHKGRCANQNFELMLWQKFIEGSKYGWFWKKNRKRRFHYVYEEEPRKNGKTTRQSGSAIYDLGYDGESGAEVYCAATKEEQSKILWKGARVFVSRSPQLSSEIRLKMKEIVLRDDEMAFIKPLGADSTTLDGLNPYVVKIDELHAWKNRDLWDVLEDAIGSRDNWRFDIITTAGMNQNSICYEIRKHLINILNGTIEDDSFFGIIYTIDDEDIENWDDPKIWRKANPALGVAKSEDDIAVLAKNAANMPSKLNAFLNKQLNVWVSPNERWIPIQLWKKCLTDDLKSKLNQKYCYAGLDLARVKDLSALVLVFPPQNGLDDYYIIPRFYCPEEDIESRRKRDKVPYDVWAREGLIITTPGNTTDFSFIRQDVLDLSKTYEIKEIAFDRTFSGELVNNLMDDGMTMVQFGQGFFTMGSPTAELERLIVGCKIKHFGHPILEWNFSNVIIRMDPAGSIKPDKQKSTERIDGVVATIMGLGRCMVSNEKPSVYEMQDIINI